MKTYFLLISQYFPATHPRKGECTNFCDKILVGCIFDQSNSTKGSLRKIHTIRANYNLWKKRIDEVNAGEAVLSLRYWTGRPRHSKQQEVVTFSRGSGIGVQKICFPKNSDPVVYDDFGYLCKVGKTILAKNDGLSFDDFEAWFKGYDLSKPMAIIHFPYFRY
jgi:hypothetical protein